MSWHFQGLPVCCLYQSKTAVSLKNTKYSQYIKLLSSAMQQQKSHWCYSVIWVHCLGPGKCKNA